MTSLTADITIDALKAAYHTTLKQVLGRLETVKRLDRAMDILTRDERYTFTRDGMSDHPGYPERYQVSGPNGDYIVNTLSQTCTCPDGEQLCKHRLAVRLCLLAKRGYVESPPLWNAVQDTLARASEPKEVA